MNPEVHLKPFWGIQPKYYLAWIYGILLAAALFFVLFWPGLARPGTQVTVTSTPPGAAVSWAGKTWGVTPLTVFFPEGTSDLVVSKAAFVSVRRSFASGNNLVLSLFFPRTEVVNVSLVPQSSQSVARRAFLDVGKWALQAPFSDSHPFPPLFTNLVIDAQAAGFTDSELKTLLLQLRPWVADPAMYADYGRALGLWVKDPPEGLEAQAKLWEPLLTTGDAPSTRLVFWLLANQGVLVRDQVLASGGADFQARREAWQKANLTLPDSPDLPDPSPVKTPWGVFRGVGAQWFFWGQTADKPGIPTQAPFQLPVPVQTAAFWLAGAPVTQADFATFLGQNPDWAPDAAVSRGEADEGYLGDWKNGQPPQPSAPATQISWYAAQAYVKWLNTQPKRPEGKRFVLPTEFQWESAARQKTGKDAPAPVTWEWTSSAFAPGDALTKGENPVAPPAYEPYARTAKGGKSAWDRAGVPAMSSSPVIGFRLALETAAGGTP